MWKDTISRSYGHTTISLIATCSSESNNSIVSMSQSGRIESLDSSDLSEQSFITGLLPLVRIRHWLFGNSLVSMPFCDAGGILADNTSIERMLIENGLRTANALHIPILELRQYQPLTCLDDREFISEIASGGTRRVKTVSGWYVSALMDNNKVRMFIDLPSNPDVLMKSFKPKLRSHVRKPIKEGLNIRIGGVELVDDFYNVFAENMRDLGSPVHSKKFIVEMMKAFSNSANMFIVYRSQKPLAGSVTIGFKNTLSNPWASSLRRYNHLAPNMLLYWSMLEFACQNGYRHFDFGRSTLGEGTYKFKEQWGAKPEPLYWYRFSKTDDQGLGSQPGKDKMNKAIEYWKKLPVSITKIIGPRIRKYISL